VLDIKITVPLLFSFATVCYIRGRKKTSFLERFRFFWGGGFTAFNAQRPDTNFWPM